MNFTFGFINLSFELKKKKFRRKILIFLFRFYIKLLILLLSVILFIFNESITFRLKRTICSYFYPQREKKRIIHLYNQMLKRRRTLFISMAREVKRQLLKKHKLQMKINILTVRQYKNYIST